MWSIPASRAQATALGVRRGFNRDSWGARDSSERTYPFSQSCRLFTTGYDDDLSVLQSRRGFDLAVQQITIAGSHVLRRPGYACRARAIASREELPRGPAGEVQADRSPTGMQASRLPGSEPWLPAMRLSSDVSGHGSNRERWVAHRPWRTPFRGLVF